MAVANKENKNGTMKEFIKERNSRAIKLKNRIITSSPRVLATLEIRESAFKGLSEIAKIAREYFGVKMSRGTIVEILFLNSSKKSKTAMLKLIKETMTKYV